MTFEEAWEKRDKSDAHDIAKDRGRQMWNAALTEAERVCLGRAANHNGTTAVSVGAHMSAIGCANDIRAIRSVGQ